MATRTIYLVRHGQYYNQALASAMPDGSLSKLGQQQAQALATRLAALPIEHILHSPSIRARETAAWIQQQHPRLQLQPEPLLLELIPSIPSEPALSESTQAFFAQIEPPLIDASAAQFAQLWQRYFGPAQTDDHMLLVSHGNLISAVVAAIFGAASTHWINADIQHCGLTELTITAQGWRRLIRHGDVGHLPLAQQTFV
ncbi:histidine phosphatase family protein [Herpetosiphon geysericola]|uniref:histidine phosphatase family protein n=1 Tax=Herpetosiphon geysericola TaxID=70996 RepID=UPI0006C93597|nr:histidine phosphatase family protein [Herpetosiphon geysericola]